MDVMRVLHMITKGDVGGAQTHLIELALGEQGHGLSVAVLAGTGGPAVDRLRREGVTVEVIDSLGRTRSRPSMAAIRDVSDAVRRFGPDVVHGHSSSAGLLARVVARRAGIPSVYTAHGWPFQKGAGWRQRAVSYVGESIAGRLGSVVICLTDAEVDKARRAHVVPPDRLVVIPNGLSDVEPSLRRPSGRRQVGADVELVMVARFAPPKQQRALIDSMREVPGCWRLTFVGDGPELESVRVHGRAVLGERVRFLGHRDDVPVILANSDVLVLWSRYEGLPISLIEGMRAGLCCVASELAGPRTLFGPQPVGVLAADPSALRRSISDLIEQPDLIDRYGEAARRRFEAEFSAEAMCNATESVYSSVVRQRY
jgi:glycosyltransferase involved in cell wall biosynthesis